MSLHPVSPSGRAAAETTPPHGDWLACSLDGVEYGIAMRHVHEIRAYERPTRIAGMAACIKGVTNLRGVILPIVDLRIRLGLAAVRDEASTVVVVLNIGRRAMGLVVDAVSEVVRLRAVHVQPAQPFYADLPGAQQRSIAGAASIGSRTLRLIDVEKLLAGDDIGLLEPTLQ